MQQIVIVTRMRKLLGIYLQSSLHVSFSICALTALYYLQNDIPVDTALLLFIFCASVVGYNFIKFAPLIIREKWKSFKRFPYIMVITSMAFTGAFLGLFYLSVAVLGLTVFLGFLVYWYTFPISNNAKNLRHHPLLKLFTIAWVWANISILFPVLEQQAMNLDDSIFPFELAERMVWVLVLMIPFEIRDADDDARSGNSIISYISIKDTKVISGSFIFLFILLRYVVNGQLKCLPVFIYSSLFILLVFTKKKQHRYYSAFFVESFPIFWLLWAWIY